VAPRVNKKRALISALISAQKRPNIFCTHTHKSVREEETVATEGPRGSECVCVCVCVCVFVCVEDGTEWE
jgi:hypothetical protein